MNVLICGADGFIGAALGERLAAVGHTVVRGVRRPGSDDDVCIDYSRDVSAEDWIPRLQGIDAVINAVGILVERPAQRFENIHCRGPIALFSACAKAGVCRVIQVSALGVERGNTRYFASKLAADAFLRAQPPDWQIVRPALVYGANGASAKYFRTLASLPVMPVPAQGRQLVQPVHIDDLTQVILTLLDSSTPARQCVDVVGPHPLEYREMLQIYRRSMGFAPAWMQSVPASIVSLAARIGDLVPGALLTTETWSMLQAGNTGNVGETVGILGREPRRVEDFIDRRDALAMRLEALASWRGPLLRVSLAVVWIMSALVTLLAYPVSGSLELLARVGLRGAAATGALYGAVALDLLLGVATLVRPSRRLWLLEAITIAAYSTVIIIALPEFLAHPFGPIIKNLPLLAILFVLFSEETRT